MPSLARGTTGVVARLLVVVLLLGTSIPVAAHGDAGHDPCEAGEPSGATGGPILHVPGTDTTPRHCEVCHWLRSLRAFDVVVVVPSAPAEGESAALPLGVPRVTHLRTASAPSRAPPA